MILKRISILNYKNIREADIELSPKINFPFVKAMSIRWIRRISPMIRICL